MLPKPAIHVVPNRVGSGWEVREDGQTEPVSLHRTQQDALEVARFIAKYRRCELRIHERDDHARAPAPRAERGSQAGVAAEPA
jgi:hypothetical protein